MASLYIRKDSPYYWVRYYDVHEEDPGKRPKGLPTKILVTEADKAKRAEWVKNGKPGKPPKPHGNKKTTELLQRVISASVDLNIEAKTGLKVKSQKTLHSGFLEYLNSKPQLTEGTIASYKLAEWHLREAIGDKAIQSITMKDYHKLLQRFSLLGTGITTQAIYTRSLYAIFRYFFKKRYIPEVPIIVLKAPKKDVEPIPVDDMKVILDYFESRHLAWKDERKKAEARDQYYLIYFLLLTGVRISTALVQTWEKIDLQNDIMTAINVKAGNKTFYFPIYPELKDLLIKMGPGNGNLFNYSYKRDSPAFWKRTIKILAKKDEEGNSKIKKEYHLHDLRKTFTSWMVNSGVDPGVLQELLNHSDIRTTKEHYTKMEAGLLSSQFKNIRFKR